MAKKTKAQKTSAVDATMTDFVAALAQSADTAALPSKAERIAKRQAKRQRKQEEHANYRREQKKRKEEDVKKAAAGNSNRTSQRQERILAAWKRDWQALATLHAENPRYSPIVETADRKARNYTHSVQHKKMKNSLEPRKSDYGGLGLARPTLYLPFSDPSWLPRLEAAFAEHIPGWSGKPPMMQAMKKQRDANLLWKRLQREKTKSSKAMRHLTPDERVEQMLKAGDLV